jgi:hypothetical protein
MVKLLRLFAVVVVFGGVHSRVVPPVALACNDQCIYDLQPPSCCNNNCGLWFEELGRQYDSLCTNLFHECINYQCVPIENQSQGTCDTFFVCSQCTYDDVYCCSGGGCF